VLGTTVRLWVQRRVLRRPSPERVSLTRRQLLAVIAGVAVVVFAAGALTVALSGGTRAGRAAGNPADSSGTGALTAALAARQHAASWIAAQVSPGAIVGCDPVMCAALHAHGFPAGNLQVLSTQSHDPLPSAIVVSTDVVRNLFGRRLASVYAPAVIASFGSGQSQVAVRVTAADGSAAYLVGLRADVLARRAYGEALLSDRHVSVAAAARRVLAAGQVDSRLLITFVTLAAHLQVDVLGFGGRGPGASPGVPARSADFVVLTTGRPGVPDLQSALQFLRQQQPPFRAASAKVTRAFGRTVIQVNFAAPSPLGLLGAGAP
jgi:hypothetical protein